MKTFVSALLIGLLALPLYAAEPVIDTSVNQVARAWLAHLDNGHTDAAWEAGSPVLKKSLALEDWQKAMKGLSFLGTARSRALSSVTFANKMPHSVDGSYALLHYDTAFENKANTVETVILLRDDDQVWRSVGYLVK